MKPITLGVALLGAALLGAGCGGANDAVEAQTAANATAETTAAIAAAETAATGDHPQVSLHLDLYAASAGRTSDEMARILHCGVERYGARFIPALGVLDDGAGRPDQFIAPETLQRDLKLSRAAGVPEVWLFGVNGMTENVVHMLHETLPLEPR